MAASTCAVFACLAVILACLSVSDGFQAVKGMADGRNFVKSAPSLPRDVLKWSSSPTYTSGDFAVVASGIEVAVVHIPTNRIVFVSFTDAQPLVTGQAVNMTVQQFSGNFVVKRPVQVNCTSGNFTVTTGKPSGAYATVTLSGPLLCGAGASSAAAPPTFSLTFQAEDVTGPAPAKDTHQHMTFSVNVAGVAPSGVPLTAVRLAYSCGRHEAFYGFGHQYTYMNQATHYLPIFTQEQGVGRGLQPVTSVLDTLSHGGGGNAVTTYTSMPVYVTSANNSVMLTSTEYAVADLTWSQYRGIFAWEVQATTVRGRILAGASVKEILQSMTAFTGRQQPLPTWVDNGAVLGLEGGTTAVSAVVNKTIAAAGDNPPVAAVWLQDWTGERNFSGPGELPRVGLWWNWEVDETHYPGWVDFISDLDSRDVKLLVYLNPLLKNISARGTPYKHDYYAEALAKDYLVRLSDGTVWLGYGGAGLANLSNPDAAAWFRNIIKTNVLDANIAGWMSDFGECLPFDAQDQPGMPAPAALHSQYPLLWQQQNKQAVADAGKAASVAYFSRSASLMSPGASSLMWMGDQLVTWDRFDGLQSAIVGSLSAGYSGLTLTSSDIGGYTSLDVSILHYIRSAELLHRWCESEAFSVMYRSHPGSEPHKDAQFYDNPTSLQQYLRMARVFRAWSFYRRQLMEEAASTGVPVRRHMRIEFPMIDPSLDVALQFMIGSAILVAPVVTPDATTVDAFLPAGTSWQLVWDRTNTFVGADANVTIAAPVGQPAVLLRTDAFSDVGQQFVANLVKEGVLPAVEAQ